MPAGQSVDVFTLAAGTISVRVLTLGGIVQAVLVPDSNGNVSDVALGYPDLAGYLSDTAYHGALIGRYANRIAGGRFTVYGKTCRLSTNENGNTLHGGRSGFNAAIWKVEQSDGASLTLSHVSGDGDQGFPGTLRIVARYHVHPPMTLRLELSATTDAPTVLNLCNHTYWNLSGADTILDHTLEVAADTFNPIDSHFIPTGEIRDVANTALDLRTSTPLRRHVTAQDAQLVVAGGIDHNFVLRASNEILRAAILSSQTRTLEVWTTEPGLQVYTGQSLGGSAPGKDGMPYGAFAGIALETQHFPNSPNIPAFPSTVLRPGQTYRSITEFRFSN